jgi:hypothetical protein
MKFAMIAILSSAAMFAADVPAKKPASRKPAAAAKAAPAKPKVTPVTIPASAVKVDDTNYRYTDAAGKTWMYKKTPFGIAKIEEGAAAPPAAAPVPGKPADASPFGKLTTDTPEVRTNVKDSGDSLQFERATPFGTQKWTRKKAELNDEERAMWERQKAK